MTNISLPRKADAMSLLGGVLLFIGIVSLMIPDRHIEQVPLHHVGWAAIFVSIVCLVYPLIQERIRGTIRTKNDTRIIDNDRDPYVR